MFGRVKIWVLLVPLLLLSFVSSGQVAVDKFFASGIKFFDLSTDVSSYSKTIFDGTLYPNLGAPSAVSSSGKIMVGCADRTRGAMLLAKKRYTLDSGWAFDTIVPTFSDTSLFFRDVSLLRVDEKKSSDRAFVFNCDSVLFRNVSMDMGDSWSGFSSIHGIGGRRVSYIHRAAGDGRLIAYFSGSTSCSGGIVQGNSGNKNSPKMVVYSIRSFDNGLSWTLPEVALKHNIYSLSDVSIARYTKGGKTVLIMVTTVTDQHVAMISKSFDDGLSWSYPVQLPAMFNGNYHRVAIYGKELYFLFGQNKIHNGKACNGDVLLWYGKVNDFPSGNNFGGYLARIIDSGAKICNSCNTRDGVVEVLPYNKKRASLVLHIQEPNSTYSVKSYLLNSKGEKPIKE